MKSLYNQGITHVLNMARELQFDLQHLNMLPHIKVMSINAHDTQEYNIRGDFQKAFDFIDDAFVNNGRYYIFIKVFFFCIRHFYFTKFDSKNNCKLCQRYIKIGNNSNSLFDV